jgi:hypothetical protein
VIARAAGVLAATALLIGCMAAARSVRAQSATPSWTFTASAGGFAVGTGRALARWLDRNAYGVSHTSCGFDLSLEKICNPTDVYPRSETSRLGATVGLRRAVYRSIAVEVLVSNEQSGTVTGRCDVTATPRDARCTEPFIVMDFSGVSMASLLEIVAGKLRVGAGPALLYANWSLKPAHLAGLWLDATYGVRSSPFVLRAQYRVYGSTRSPTRGFGDVTPSTLFLGLGLAVSRME